MSWCSAARVAWADERITDYSVGRAFATISSSYDSRPQIATLPSDPQPRIIPVHPTPPIAGLERGFKPRPKQYGGFIGIEQTVWAPPDPTLAVGPNHVLETVNMRIAWWTKDGTLQFAQNLDDSGSPGFFEDVGGRWFTFDPKCIYDEHAGRFIVLALEVYDQEAWITFAVSDDSDPNGVWYKYRTDAVTSAYGAPFWVDYPGLGVDKDAIYVTGNLFGFAGGFAGTKYRIIPKTAVLSGQPAVYFDMWDPGAASTQVAHVHDSWLAAYFVSVQSGTEIKIQAITDPTTAPVLWTTSATVNAFGYPPGVPVLGGGTVDALDGRLINAYFRNRMLYTGHGVGLNGKTLARWYEFSVGSWPMGGSVAARQQGEVDLGSDVFSWFPAIARNAAGDIGMVMARGGASEYPSVWYARREPSDPPGTMQPARELKAGEAGYSGRWGDYFDIAVDPENDWAFWGVGEFARSFGWSTYIGRFAFTPATVSYIEPGFPGSVGLVPDLIASAPIIGATQSIAIGNSTGGLSYFLVVGVNPGEVSLLGCPVHIGFPWSLFGPLTLDGLPFPGYGHDELAFALPYDPSFLGVTAYLQALILDPGAAHGLAATHAAELHLGDV
ncbi:MAG: hypothetical protein U1E76_14940 [Planctomycetota bacterium]